MSNTVIGTGYLGLVTGAYLADVGIEVTCVDIDQKKIDGLKNGILPIYESGLKEILGWEPNVMREEGLENTCAWFKKFPDEVLFRKGHRTFGKK